MVTRFYLPSTGTAAVTPAYDALWTVTPAVTVRPCSTVKSNTPLALTALSDGAETSPSQADVLIQQFVSSNTVPVPVTVGGTMSAVIGGRESNASADAILQIVAKVVSEDGTVVRGVLYAGQTSTTRSATITNINAELSTVADAARTFNAVAVSDVAVQAGDRIVIEVGWRALNLSTTSYAAQLKFGDPTAAADAPLAATSTTLNTVPWVEFSADIFPPVLSGAVAGGYTYTGTVSGSTVRSGTVGGSYAYAGTVTGETPGGLSSGTVTGGWHYTAVVLGDTPAPSTPVGTVTGGYRYTGYARGGPPGVPTDPPGDYGDGDGGGDTDYDNGAYDNVLVDYLERASTPRVHVYPSGAAKTAAKTVAEFGRLRVRAGNENITSFRGVPIQVKGWGSLDPGGHDAATIEFPQIHVAEAGAFQNGNGDLSWFKPGVQLHFDALLDGELTNLWRGRARAINTTGNRITLECDGDLIGPMSWATYRPTLKRLVEDIGWSISKQIPLSSHVKIDPLLPTTGIEWERKGSRADSRWGWCLNTLALAQTRGGVQWTILPKANDPGTYELVHRDLTSHDLTIHIGMPGVEADLLFDITSRPTRYYGEGQRPDGGRWYGAVFPYLNTTPPPFPGTLQMGDSGEQVMVLFRTLGRYGLNYDDVTHTFNAKIKDAVEEAQSKAGLPETGVVNEATWNAIFTPSTDNALYGAHYETLVERSAVRATDRTQSGLIIGQNPDYDPSVPVVDSFVGFGAGTYKSEAREWCRVQMQQDFGAPEWSGTINLTTDPQQMSRFAIRAGMNFWDPDFGDGTVFHIASVSVDWASGSVSCDVSTRGRDYLDVTTIIERNKAARAHPAKRFAAQLSRKSAQSQDMRSGWDYEGGAGIIPKTQLEGGEWAVIPVFVGQAGSVGEVSFRATDQQTEYCVAIFARPVTANKVAHWSPDPLAERAEDGSWVTDASNVDELHGTGGGGGSSGGAAPMQPCVNEDSPGPCYWDAQTMGNGEGNSYVRLANGTLEYRNPTAEELNPSYSPPPVDEPTAEAQLELNGRLTEGKLLVYAAGTGTTPTDAPMPCGYWPHVNAGKSDNNSLGSNLTGRWKDDAAFDYWTYGDGPFLYVAVWPRHDCTFQGRLYPSMVDGGM